jgi:hypothetical protein
MNTEQNPEKKRNPLTPEQAARYREASRQTDAINRLEGFEKTGLSCLIDEAILSGLLTSEEIVEEITEYAMKHKNIEGYLPSCFKNESSSPES